MWTGIEFLRILQDIRLDNQFLEDFFLIMSSKVFYLLLPIAVAFIFYWCIDKRKGEIIGLGCVSAMVFSMTVKFGIAQPRPWDMDPSIIQVEGAHANGYSCPSGHSAITAASLPVAARFSRYKSIALILVVITALIIAGRLILCVHTPLDIICGVAIAVVAALASWKCIEYSYTSDRAFHIVTGAYLLFFTAIFLAGIFAWNADVAEISDFAGFFYGFMIGRELEHRYVVYEAPDKGFKDGAVRFILGMLVGAVLLLVPMEVMPYGTFVGGILMMIWATFVYTHIMKNSSFFAKL